MKSLPLDSPLREPELRRLLARKASLRRYYLDIYGEFAACISRSNAQGACLELGSGCGFARELIPELITSDVLAYQSVHCHLDARQLPFADKSLRALLLFNVFHHIPDVEAFLSEASRVLATGGRVLIVDPYPSPLSSPIYRYLHHEPFDPNAKTWAFNSTGPLSDANNALAWIVFFRDRQRFEALYPRLQVLHFQPHSPLRYWLCGGLKSWSLLPGWLYPAARLLDGLLARLSSRLCSFVTIELVKEGNMARPQA